MSPLSGNESDFLLHTRGIRGFLQFPKRTRLHLGSKNNLEMKANLLIENGSEIRHFLFLLQPNWEYQFRRQFGILFRWWYGLRSGNQTICLDLNIVWWKVKMLISSFEIKMSYSKYSTTFQKKIWFLKSYLFTCLHQVSVAACRIFTCGVWGLVPWPRNEPGPSALAAWSLSHWTTTEIPENTTLILFSSCIYSSRLSSDGWWKINVKTSLAV